MKGVILAGGLGTRLMPMTTVTNKHMVPILNKPMLTYPLQTLIALGIKDIIIISGGGHIGHIAEFFGDGSEYGVSLTYRVQKKAGGIAEALGLARNFANGEAVTVILGDNIFGVDDWLMRIARIKHHDDGSFSTGSIPEDRATLVVKKSNEASRFGVLLGGNFIPGDPDHMRIVEKPKDITTGDVVTGLYVYPPEVFNIIPDLIPSARGEIEITDVNNYFLTEHHCRICHLQEQDFWSDAGTPESLYRAIKFIAQEEGYEAKVIHTPVIDKA